jgi:hypothetical protein
LVGLINAGRASEGLQNISSGTISSDRNFFEHVVSEANWIFFPFSVHLAKDKIIEGELVQWLGLLSWLEFPNEWKNIWAEIRTEVNHTIDGISNSVVGALEDTVSVANEGFILERMKFGFEDFERIWESIEEIGEVLKETNGLGGDTIRWGWDNWVLRAGAAGNELSLLEPDILARSEG